MLKGKKILIGVSGSIAAYKVAFLIRLLKKEEAEVQVVMTPSASSFITPLTLATLSENPVLIDFQKDKSGTWNNHVELGLWADAMVVAPASANTLAKMANGICDNLLMAVYLSARCPVFFCPAMDLDMFAHPSTVRNIDRLEHDKNILIDAESGELASGLSGKGRMAEPEHIVNTLDSFFAAPNSKLAGKKVLITAGPTHEYIDPVRYISNGSTGKMGYAIADCFAAKGAKVTLISGPVSMIPSHVRGEVIRVKTAAEMYGEVLQRYGQSDISVFSAAVADYTPQKPSDKKIKKEGATLTVEMIKTKDIAKEMGLLKKPHQLNVGFALETHQEREHAHGKLIKKNFDLIVLNSLQDKGAGFGHDTNKVTFIDRQGEEPLPLKSKRQVAEDLIERIERLIG